VSVLHTWRTASEDETIDAGAELASMLPSRAVVLLTGDLGAGKTTLSKGIAQGRAGISPDEVTSPTFTLIHEYTPNVIHMDLYRLETEREVLGLGFDDLLDREALLLIEWGERFPHLIPPEHYVITLRTIDDDAREITLSKA
jgi:tRNA threonylcarbamoyladenosine biosynthesis protein TsaE